ncbi:pyruvate dehydrogenase (acetyl-transferring) kinase [Cucumis melo var. makuwa]|uniref:Protein-serine/threonine kinase n=1 Tax=Cucumis melo var. makuwa TaxID=1194695 RepID=A0A5D3BBB2_CUCMM|nr:pyruvate dehydrogenase (acetyl-transferring) kinase [Cucumis melo var. makuwa]
MAAKKLCESFSKSLIDDVQKWGCMKQTGVSLRYMMEFGSKPTAKNLLISAQFLHKELPIRIARRAIELENLPYGLSVKPAVLKVFFFIFLLPFFFCCRLISALHLVELVRDWYLDSFRDLRSFPEIKNSDDEKEFTQMIKAIKVRHNNVVPMMALGVQQLKKGLRLNNVGYQNLHEIHQFLDRFYMSRIGIRMLIGQHVELHNPNPLPDCVGYIHTKMSPVKVAESASEDARAICLREYGSAPNIKIYGDPSFTFPYVPTHLHLMVFELVKNSLRAVQERFMDSDKVAPLVRIIVADGIEDVTIKVSDEGGGIPRSGLPKIFTYLYTTAKNPLDEHPDLGTADLVTMAGYGYGLPISRLYARYFGGDLQVISMEGYGIVIVQLNFLICLSFEMLILNRHLPSPYEHRNRCLSSPVSSGGFTRASSMSKGRCKDLPGYWSVEAVANYNPMNLVNQKLATSKSHGPSLSTFDELEAPFITDLSKNCLAWSDSQPPRSVMFVSFGSRVKLKSSQLKEFFWNGLVNSGKAFLLVLRSDALMEETGEEDEKQKELVIKRNYGNEGRWVIVNWAPQEKVLRHEAIGGFLTHSGWNSTLESVAVGVPMVCWPQIGDQPSNATWLSKVWKIGVEMEDSHDRCTAESRVRSIMEHEDKKMENAIVELAKRADDRVSKEGTSYQNLQRLIEDIKGFKLN